MTGWMRVQVNLVITSDHGMTQQSTDRIIFLDDYLDLTLVDVVEFSPVAAIWPKAGMGGPGSGVRHGLVPRPAPATRPATRPRALEGG